MIGTERQSSAGKDPLTQAGDWFARLRMADCTDAERTAFERWLEQSPENAAAWRRAETAWNRAADLRGSPAIAAATREALQAGEAAHAAPRARRRWRWPAAAAMAAAVAVLSVAPSLTDIRGVPAWAPSWSPVAWSGERFITATAQQRQITLADGSTVLLDAESALRVRYRERERNLILERGQAQFKVASDPDRPFVVKAADGAVRALGTEFQVRVVGDAVTVTLLEGKVSVDVPGMLGGLLTPSRSEVLTAGQQVRFGDDRDSKKELAKQPADLELAHGWPHGELVFNRWRLEDLVVEMNRHSDTKIRIRDPNLRDLRINGRFRAGKQQSLINALQHQWPIQAEHVSETEIALTSWGPTTPARGQGT